MLGMLVLWGSLAVLTPSEAQALERVGERMATVVDATWGRDAHRDGAVLTNAASPRWQAGFVEICSIS